MDHVNLERYFNYNYDRKVDQVYLDQGNLNYYLTGVVKEKY